ncbi:MAG TPA: HAMP domain-containing sensor histidine kinase, partial [Actinospica sp.]|nr:HAMP domain-containing sensor histidine kinase [Actinospica sp.]
MPRPWSRTPLWARLLICTLGLAAIGLSVTGIVGVNLFRGYLIDQSGQQLTTVARTISNAHWNKPTDDLLNCGSLPNDNAVELVSATGGNTVFSSCGATVDQFAVQPELPSAALLAAAAAAGQPITEVGVAGSARFEWQIVVARARFRNAEAGGGSPAPPHPAGTGAAAAGDPPPAAAGPIDGYVVVATPLTVVGQTVGHLADLDYAADAAVGLALFALGYVLVRRTLRPLRRIESAAAAISAGDLTRRVPLGHPGTEIGQLSRSLNGMLGQIESAFDAKALSEAEALRSEAQMRQFAADAGHELRTPVASIRGLTELYRQGAADSRQMPDLMRRIEDEATRMGLLVEDLLLLARLDQERPLARRPVDLLAVTGDAVHDARVVAPDRDISLLVGVTDPPPVVIGDDGRLRQVLTNLLGNAVKHTQLGTPV